MKIKIVKKGKEAKYFQFDKVMSMWVEIGFAFVKERIAKLKFLSRSGSVTYYNLED